MSTRVALSPAPSVERRILSIRGQRVMLDADLASLYGVSTRALNQFRLTEAEKAEVITNCDHLQPLRFSPSLPHAFTEHGAIMLASLLSTRIAVQASVQFVRAFVRLREILATHKDLAREWRGWQRRGTDAALVAGPLTDLGTFGEYPRGVADILKSQIGTSSFGGPDA